MHFSTNTAVWLVNLLSVAAAAVVGPDVAFPGLTTNYKNCGELIPDKYVISLQPQADLEGHLAWIKTLNLGGLAGVEKRYGFKGFQAYAGNFNAVTIALIKASKDVLGVSQDSWYCPVGIIPASPSPDIEVRAPATSKLTKRATIEQQNAPANLRVVSQTPYPRTNSYYYYDSLGYGSFSYVIDSGIQITHQEFQNHAINGYTAYSGNNSDVDGHGTYVAGIIGGKTYGMAKATLLIAVKVLNGGPAPASTVLDGLNWAVNDILSQGRAKKAVINMSLGGGYVKALNDAITAANNQNVYSVVAAGNSKADVANSSPASCPEAFVVAAINDNYTSYTFESSYSNYGSLVDVFAPGTNIVSASIGASNTNLAIGSGTSASAPHVAGGIATWLVVNDFNRTQLANFVPLAAWSNKISGVPSGTPNKLFYNWSGH